MILIDTMSSNIRITKVCQFCHKEFVAKKTTTKHCSDACSKKAYKARKRIEKIQASILKPTEYIKQIKEKDELNPIKEREFLNIEQAALLLGASKMTIYRLLKKGTLRYHKIGRRTIIIRQDIDKLFGI